MIAIDSSVIIDLLSNDAGTAEGAEASLRQSLNAGPVVVCDVVLAEITTALRDGAQALGALEDMGIGFVAVESKSARPGADHVAHIGHEVPLGAKVFDEFHRPALAFFFRRSLGRLAGARVLVHRQRVQRDVGAAPGVGRGREVDRKSVV